MILAWRPAFWLSLMAMVLTVIVRMQPPIPWSQTQFLIGYDLGFVRRGLVGEIISLVFPSGVTLAEVNAIAAMLTGGSALVLFAFMCWMLQPHAMGGVALILFATSTGFASFVGNTGFLDGALLFLTVVALLPDKRRLAGVVIGAILLCLAALVHENALPFFAPILALDIWLQNTGRATAHRLALAALPVLSIGSVVLLVFTVGTPPIASLPDLLATVESKSIDFDVHRLNFETVVRLPGDIPSDYAQIFTPDVFFPRLLLIAGPGLVLLALTLSLAIGAAAHRQAVDVLVIVLCVVAPLALIFIGIDASRFTAISIINAHLALAILLRADPESDLGLQRAATPALIVAMLLLNGQVVMLDLNAGSAFTSGFPGVLMGHESWVSRELGTGLSE